MSLSVFHSERIEELADVLAARLADERNASADAFAFSQVVVPNANIAKWLRMRAFALRPQFCAGLEFPFIEQALFRAMNAALPADARAELLPMNAYAVAIMKMLIDGAGVPELMPFVRYVGGGENADFSQWPMARRAWQLSAKLAGLMDEYEVRRPEIVANWLRGAGMDGGECADETEAAEAEVARRLFGPCGAYPPHGRRLSLRQLFERVEGLSPHGAGAVYRFFGLSTLSPLQVRILRWLAKFADVEVYHNNVCLEYWGDIDGGGRVGDAIDRAENDAENPLLRDWGVAGRETMQMLVGLEEEGDGEIGFDWIDVSGERSEPSSVLEAVQRGVSRRTSSLARRGQDASLQIVAAPGIRREVEMVYNAILGQVWRGGCGDFSDVAVLVTDMRKYRPAIEAVFNARGEIPYGLVDTTASGQSDCLAAFGALVALASKGMGRETLFAVLENPCVQRAIGCAAADVREWRAAAAEIGAFDGFESVGELRNFSWGAALARMRLGEVAEDAPGRAVCRCSCSTALKFSETVERLYRTLSPLGDLRAAARDWARTLGAVLDEFVDVGDDFREEAVAAAIRETLRALDALGDAKLPLALVACAVDEFAGGLKNPRSGYLTRGVTVASLQPMRPVPFRSIFVLGMGETDFPGRESESTLDIRGAKRRLGETSTPMQNRYMFLETLMAARERLVISYVALDTQKDERKFPSGMVDELKKFAQAAILAPEPGGGDPEFREVRLPLLERGEDGDCPHESPVGEMSSGHWWSGIVPTYSRFERELAAKIASGVCRDAAGHVQNAPHSPVAATGGELAMFAEDPIGAAFRGILGIRRERMADAAHDEMPPLELGGNGPAKWKFDADVLNAPSGDVVAEVYADFEAHGALPSHDGFFGRYSLVRAKRDYEGNDDGRWLAEAKNFAAEFSASDDIDSRALVLGDCGEKPGEKIKPRFAPKAVLRPLMNWVSRISGCAGAMPRSLCVGIVDFRNRITVAWRCGGVTAADAAKWHDAAKREYSAFLASPQDDGKYLSVGWDVLVDALAKTKMERLPEQDDEASWRMLAEALKVPYGAKAASPLRAEAVISATIASLKRLPRPDEWRRLRDFCVAVHSPALSMARFDPAEI